MLRKFRITLEGKSYDVQVEILDEEEGSTPEPQPLVSPKKTPASPAAPVTEFVQPPEAAEKTSPSAPGSSEPASGGPGDLPSPLNGIVISIKVEAGQEVQEGEELITLEAMKMNTPVLADRTGKVTKIYVQPDATVQEGQPLVHLE